MWKREIWAWKTGDKHLISSTRRETMETVQSKRFRKESRKLIKCHLGSTTKVAEEHCKVLCKGHVSENRIDSSKMGFDFTNWQEQKTIKAAKMQNWTRCANQRNKQTMLKGNCCIATESAKERLYSSILNHLWWLTLILILSSFSFFFFSKGK